MIRLLLDNGAQASGASEGAWLCRKWREVRDLAEELGDDDVQSLLEGYDVRKMHMRYLRESEHLEE